MLNWKRFFATALCICLTMSILCPVALAAEEIEDRRTTCYADGSYSVTRIICDRQCSVSAQTDKHVVRATKKQNRYSSSGNLLWIFYVHGEFTYDGRTAEATGSDYSYDIYDSSWSFENGNAFYYGATAAAAGQFNHILSIAPVTLRLTCSADGTLS